MGKIKLCPTLFLSEFFIYRMCCDAILVLTLNHFSAWLCSHTHWEQHNAWRRTTWFGVAGFDLVLLSGALATSIFGRRTGTRAGSDGASTATGFITAGPRAPARPASIHWTQHNTYCSRRLITHYRQWLYTLYYKASQVSGSLVLRVCKCSLTHRGRPEYYRSGFPHCRPGCPDTRSHWRRGRWRSGRAAVDRRHRSESRSSTRPTSSRSSSCAHIQAPDTRHHLTDKITDKTASSKPANKQKGEKSPVVL